MEVLRVQDSLDFAFGTEHRDFTQSALPVGKSWPDWRHDSEKNLRGPLDWPVVGVLFDVHNNGFCPASWGDRPRGKLAASVKPAHISPRPEDRPGLVASVHGIRPQFLPRPVFPVHQTDAIFYGDDLLDYVAHEFRAPPLHGQVRTGRVGLAAQDPVSSAPRPPLRPERLSIRTQSCLRIHTLAVATSTG